MTRRKWRHETDQNDTHNNDIHHIDIQRKGLTCGPQHNRNTA
jgi:hypothetical protein